MDKTEHIWNIPAGTPFVDALANGLLAKADAKKLDLADFIVLLPNRRACRALAAAFLRQSDCDALLLPRLMPIGEIEDQGPLDENETFFEDSPNYLLPAIEKSQRILLLARLISQKSVNTSGDQPLSPGNAIRLAGDLAAFLDQVQTEGLSFSDLNTLVPDYYADHWKVTLNFLEVLSTGWPKVLEALGCIDPAARRNNLIRSRVLEWKKKPPSFPIFAAGSTGSIPATAELLEMIVCCSAGGVILPGLDTSLDSETTQLLGPTHPQYGMTRFLQRLSISPDQVTLWPHSLPSASSPERFRLLTKAFAPINSSNLKKFSSENEALNKVRLVECPSHTEEAGVIALALREVLTIPGKTGALVTPDRSLARRVAAELQRWNIEINDSAGRPLGNTPPGLFFRLIAKTFADECAPLPLLSMLKHPFAAGGAAVGTFRSNVRKLEMGVLRGPRPAAGLSGILAELRKTYKTKLIEEWFLSFCEMAKPFEKIMASEDKHSPSKIIQAHVTFAESLAATNEKSGIQRLWTGDAGAAAAEFFSRIIAAEGLDPMLPSDYPDFLDAMFAGQTVRSSFGTHPRLNIWALLEARLQNADLVCLGGLNEGSWPDASTSDPWMSRPMREAFGLPSFERRIGLSAHDFTQGFCAEEVLMTRAQKVDGSPTVPSRWLLMLETQLRIGVPNNGKNWDRKIRQRGKKLSGWQLGIDRPLSIEAGSPPQPKPPVLFRPRKLSVTAIETWRRDPYSIFARYILKLRPLEKIDTHPNATDRGNIIHKALDAFLRETESNLSDDPLEELISIGKKEFGSAFDRPGVRAFWWPRFLRIAKWFVEQEILNRADRQKAWTEIEGRVDFQAPAGVFTLTAHADRVDLLANNTLKIIDYKTGQKPTNAAIRAGFSPQLPLEAAILSANGFNGIEAKPVSKLEFWTLSGGRKPGVVESINDDIADLAQKAYEGLVALVARFDDPATPYLSQPNRSWTKRFAEYDHLARVIEWADSEEFGQ